MSDFTKDLILSLRRNGDIHLDECESEFDLKIPEYENAKSIEKFLNKIVKSLKRKKYKVTSSLNEISESHYTAKFSCSNESTELDIILQNKAMLLFENVDHLISEWRCYSILKMIIDTVCENSLCDNPDEIAGSKPFFLKDGITTEDIESAIVDELTKMRKKVKKEFEEDVYYTIGSIRFHVLSMNGIMDKYALVKILQ